MRRVRWSLALILFAVLCWPLAGSADDKDSGKDGDATAVNSSAPADQGDKSSDSKDDSAAQDDSAAKDASTDSSADEDSGKTTWEAAAAEYEVKSMPWKGESPHWSVGQPFSAVKGAGFIGSSECLGCHKELRDGFLDTVHARSLTDSRQSLDHQGCESCHGAGGAHAVLRSKGAIFAFDWKDSANTDTICLRCHEWLTSREEWKATTHAKARLSCVTCHDPHVEARHPYRWLLSTQQDLGCVQCHMDVGMDFQRASHHPVVMDAANDPTSQAMHCTDCHNVHAGKGRAMLAARTATETCLKCHVDKGGPFVFNHLSTEDGISNGCLTCHVQHGSDNEWLHVADGRALCARCHTDREDHYQPLSCWAAGCHTAIHGSNKSMRFIDPAVTP